MSRVNKSGRKKKGQKRPPARKPKPAAAKTLAAQFRVRELNAQQKCGHDTSVERLFRVDETTDGAAKAHLVFLDRRHGWYCEHGVECPAVRQAKNGLERLTGSI